MSHGGKPFLFANRKNNIKTEVIYTPKIGTILTGITRETVMKLASSAGFQVIESDITLEQAYQADEAFFNGTAAEVTPIRSINDKALGNGHVGIITATIKELYMNTVQGKNPDFMGYLTYV